MSKVQYQWEKFISNNTPLKDISSWQSQFGPCVLERKNGKAKKVKFKVLIDNPETRIFIIGNFNGWETDLKKLKGYELHHDKYSIFAEIILDNIEHKDKYKFLVLQPKKKDINNYTNYFLQDPAGVYFDEDGNTIFWDYDDPTTYIKKHSFINTINRSTKIMQTDLPGMIVHWKDSKGQLGKDIPKNQYYNFISDSGILDYIKDLGFNTIQFLPFAQSIDGDNWKYRYLVPFQFAIQKNWGTPDDFMRMIDECHKKGIAVIGDFVISHLPYKDFNIFKKSFKENGIHQWINRHGYELYMKEPTSWGTMRVDYDNEFVRKFMISSCLHYMKHYKIDGFRIDNVDGILRFGESGQGEERPNGRNFLKELNSTIYDYNPQALIHFEAHYFYKDNAKLLVIPLENDKKALGATAYNSSRLTYYFHKDYMLKSADEISAWKFKHINDEKEWGQSNSTVADFHNHDAAAGLMELRATGSYAYDTMTIKQPHNHFHAVGKIKVMEAIISFLTEGRTLNLIQTFLLQTGTFEHDSSIKWFLNYNQCNRNLLNYKKEINHIMDDPAFWPIHSKNRNFLNIDEINKIIVIERSSHKSTYIILINLSSWIHHNYKIGVKGKQNYEVIINADLFEYSGSGMANYPNIFNNKPSNNFELLDREVEIPLIAPYQILILKKLK